MAIFTQRFPNADDYEDWLQKASGRVNVLSIVKPRTVYGSTVPPPPGPVILKYQTVDKSLAPPKSTTQKTMEYAIAGAAFLALFAYIVAEL